MLGADKSLQTSCLSPHSLNQQTHTRCFYHSSDTICFLKVCRKEGSQRFHTCAPCGVLKLVLVKQALVTGDFSLVGEVDRDGDRAPEWSSVRNSKTGLRRTSLH